MIRHSVQGRTAEGLLEAQLGLSQYDFASRFPVPRKGAKAAGVRFEKKIVKELEAIYPMFIAGIPFHYRTRYNPRNNCLPDGILFREKDLVIIEIKLRHTADAWWQLRKLYQPVAVKAMGRPVRLLEICKYYEPEVRVPESQPLFASLEQFLVSRVELGCLIWGR